MALPGMRSTADFAADQRPKNWREGILLLEPRNKAPLFALTAAMGSQSTDDPEFYWWEEAVDMHLLTTGAAALVSDTTIQLTANGTRLKTGDALKNVRTGEAVRVVSVTDDTHITVTRAFGPGSTAAGTAAAMNNGDTLQYIGSAYREGASRPGGVSWNPSKFYNVTQIFRDSIEQTRTASKTRTRTGDELKNDRRRALNKHSIGIERALIFGTQYETTENGQPIRFTDGILNRIDSGNVQTVSGGDLTLAELEDYMVDIFAYGSNEKLCFCGLGTMMKLNQLVRKNTMYQWGPSETEFKLSVKRFFTPAGALVLTEHPLFSQAGAALAEDLLIIDTMNLKYRYVTDTVLLKDRQNPGDDGIAEEYLTECGLEIQHPKTHFWLKGISTVSADA